MAVTKICVWFVIYLSTLKEASTEITCEIEDDDGEVVRCSSINDTIDHNVVQTGMLSAYKNATSLSLASCNIEAIETDVFKELTLLKSLDLSGNFLNDITVGTFDGLTELEELNLSDNYLEDLPVNVFEYNVKLEKLSLRDNIFYWFDVGIFDNLVNLKNVDFSNNQLDGKNWKPEVLIKNVEILSINFSENDMSNSPDNLLSSFNKLAYINLSSCRLTEFPSFLMSTDLKELAVLTLKNNLIRKLDKDVFQNFENLSILDLSFNEIEYIADNSFRTLKKITILSLKKNNLVTISNRLFSSMDKLYLLDLSKNMITVLQDDIFKRNSNLKYLNVAHNRLTYLQQNFCRQQKKTRTALKKFLFNHNPWQCACLRELLHEAKELGIKYNSTYFDGGQPVCVTTSEFVCKRLENLNSFYSELFDSTVPKTL